MFCYCNNNPVIHADYAGQELEHVLKRDIGMGYGAVGLYLISLPTVYSMVDAGVELAQDIGDAITTASEIASSKIKEQKTDTYSVYFLSDANGTIQYVGRVKDKGYDARMSHHKRTRGLDPKYRIAGLSADEARGLEEMGMIECHTLNALNPINNQIHGISSSNKQGERYMKEACDYLFNRAEDWIINIFE